MLAAYTAIAVWLTWPLARRATTDLPNPAGAFRQVDILSAAWLLAWHTHALTTDPALLPSPNAFHPTPHALFYAPPALGPLPLFAPVYAASGSASLAYAVAFLAGLALAALGVAEVVRRWTRCVPAAFLAGLALLASPTIRTSAGTAPLCAMLVGLPWIVYGGAQRPLGAGGAAVLVGALVLQSLVDPIFATLGALVPLGLVAAARIARASARRDGWRLVACIGIACALTSPLSLGYLVAWRGLDPAHPGPWSAPIAALLESVKDLPAPSLPSIAIGTQPAGVWYGVGIVALGALLAWRRGGLAEPGWRHAALWAGLGFVLGVPTIAYAVALGRPEILDRLGPLRSLQRLSTDLLAGGPLLVGLAIAELYRRVDAFAGGSALARRALTAAALVVMLAELAPRAPYETLPAPSLPPSLRTAIARTGGPVLELPVGQPPFEAAAMYRSIGEWWPLVNGYASFWPRGFAERMDAARRLPDRDALQTLVDETGLRAVVVTLRALPPASRAAWSGSDGPARAGLRRIAEEGGQIAFAVDLGDG